jgi:hypothetical protein
METPEQKTAADSVATSPTVLAEFRPARTPQCLHVLQVHSAAPGHLITRPAGDSDSPGEPGHWALATSRPDGAVDKPHVINFEDAPGGTLAAFCQNHAGLVMSPKLEDRLNLWYQMFHLIDDIDMIFGHRG